MQLVYYGCKLFREIDGKSYEAYVKEKEEAKKVYNEAQSQGQSAGLVEKRYCKLVLFACEFS